MSGLLRGFTFGGSGLIRGLVFDLSGLLRGITFGGSGPIRGFAFDLSVFRRGMDDKQGTTILYNRGITESQNVGVIL